MQIITTLAVLATAISTAQAGKAYIYNRCPEDVYVWPIDANRNPTSPIKIAKGGDPYVEDYHTPATGGVSLKLSKTPQLVTGKITQFEYTVASYGASSFWYDGSNVDCDGSNCPFYNDGIYLKTSDPSCPTRTCTPGQVCTGFYTLWNDDINSLSCSVSADTSMYLCATSDSGSAAVSSVAVPSPIAAAVAVASSYVAPLVQPASSSTSTSTSSPVPTTTSSSVSVAVTTSSSKPAQMNEAVATTLITVTKNAYRHKPSKRAEPHAHARRHQHHQGQQ